MKSDTEIFEPKKNGKLSKRLTMTCIVPALVLFTIVCIISIATDKRIIIQSMKNSINGQNSSKVSDTDESLRGIIKTARFSELSIDIKNYYEEEDYAEIMLVLEKVSGISNKVQVAQYYNLTDDVFISNNGKQKIQTDYELYDDEKLNSGEAHYVIRNIVENENIPIASYIYPVENNITGKYDSFITINFNNNALISKFTLSTPFKTQKWMLISDDNHIIYHSLAYNKEIFDGIEKVVGSYDNSSFTNWFNGQEYIISFNRFEEFNNMGLMYVLPVSELMQNSIVSMIFTVVITIISFVILSVFIFLFSRKIVNEVNGIRKKLSSLKNGDYTGKISTNSSDEIGELVNDFNSVVETLKYKAEHDGKTGFLNENTFALICSDVLKNNPDKKYMLIRADIDNFSFINDIFDWGVGDELLVNIAKVLKGVFIDSIYGYLGNDIFVIMCEAEDERCIKDKITKAAELIKKSELRMPITPHFGVCDCIYPNSDIRIICDYAGIALKTVKGNLLQTYAFYDKKSDEDHKMKKFVESNKQKALDDKNFYILIQPKYNIETGKVVGGEALVRWREPETNQIIPPNKFIPIFEKNGFILTLDRYVWEEACKVIRRWIDSGYEPIPISVNVSRMHIYNPEFVNDLEKLVNKYNIPAHLLEIEITESALLKNGEADLERVMKDLNSRGFRLLMDDFASGYSSLISLLKLPFDVIKIDKALIDHIDNPDNNRFVSGTVSFLMDLKKEIVVEGVEYNWQKEKLRETGNEDIIVQGYCFSKPISVEDFENVAFKENV